jgi:hypothetical protein
MSDARDRAITVGLVVLAVPDLITGAWAVLDPSGFFRHFPGLGQHWVVVEGAYNRHLTTDAGAGFLAVGIVVLLAVFCREAVVRRIALIGYLVQDVPHLVYHLAHPAHALSTGSRLASDGGLAAGAALAVVLLVALQSRSRVPLRSAS